MLGRLAPRRRALSSVTRALRPLRVGGVPEHFNTPWHTAIAAGRFDELGLQVEWQEYPGGTGAMAADLRRGELDLAVLLTEGIVTELHTHDHSKILATYVRTPLTWGVHVHHSSFCHSVEALHKAEGGARFAVSRMGSGSHLMAAVDARSRGVDPASLQYEVVGSLQGARQALAEGQAAAFMWEKFTTKPLVDSGEWRRVGECVTPWPCFVVAATNTALEKFGPDLLEVLEVVRREAEELESSPHAAETVGTMYGLEDTDVREWLGSTRWSCRRCYLVSPLWLGSTRWSCRPAVSHAMLQDVMNALSGVGVLKQEQLLPPASLVAGLAADVDPDLIVADDN